jgi:hypothetical protein
LSNTVLGSSIATSGVGRRGLSGGPSEAEIQLLECNAVDRNRLVVGAPHTGMPKGPSDFKGFDFKASVVAHNARLAKNERVIVQHR